VRLNQPFARAVNYDLYVEQFRNGSWVPVFGSSSANSSVEKIEFSTTPGAVYRFR
jgi:hypothetical protein